MSNVVVTGAGRGIGREHALMLAEHGAAVVVGSLVAEQFERIIACPTGGWVGLARGGEVLSPDGDSATVKMSSSPSTRTFCGGTGWPPRSCQVGITILAPFCHSAIRLVTMVTGTAG